MAESAEDGPVRMGGVPIKCSLPIERGEESTDIIVYQQGSNLVYILATTVPNDISLWMSPKMDPDAFAIWPRHICPDQARAMVLWATRWVKDIHIKTKCTVGKNMERVRELILSMASVSFLHPSAIYNTDTHVAPASIAGIGVGEKGVCIKLKATLPDRGTRAHESEIVNLIENRPAAVFVWSIPFDKTVSSRLYVPYPQAPAGKTMNSTVIVLGDLVCEQANAIYTYHTKVDNSDISDLLPNINTSRATITYLGDCKDVNFPSGMHYATQAIEKGISEGRRIIMLNGASGTDMTTLGLVRFADYNGMCVPLVCGCAVRDSVRYERAHIPLVFLPTRSCEFSFEDSAVPNHIVFYASDGVPPFQGTIDVSKKEKHGTMWWVTLTK